MSKKDRDLFWAIVAAIAAVVIFFVLFMDVAAQALYDCSTAPSNSVSFTFDVGSGVAAGYLDNGDRYTCSPTQGLLMHPDVIDAPILLISYGSWGNAIAVFGSGGMVIIGPRSELGLDNILQPSGFDIDEDLYHIYAAESFTFPDGSYFFVQYGNHAGDVTACTWMGADAQWVDWADTVITFNFWDCNADAVVDVVSTDIQIVMVAEVGPDENLPQILDVMGCKFAVTTTHNSWESAATSKDGTAKCWIYIQADGSYLTIVGFLNNNCAGWSYQWVFSGDDSATKTTRWALAHPTESHFVPGDICPNDMKPEDIPPTVREVLHI